MVVNRFLLQCGAAKTPDQTLFHNLEIWRAIAISRPSGTSGPRLAIPVFYTEAKAAFRSFQAIFREDARIPQPTREKAGVIRETVI
jgi:hypothetical protein